MKLDKRYELSPNDGRKSFYCKCYVREYDDCSAVLESYGQDVLKRTADGRYIRLWPGWSATTGRHIYAFAPIRKKDWDKMQPGKPYYLHEIK